MRAWLWMAFLLHGAATPGVVRGDMQLVNVHAPRNDRFYGGADRAFLGEAYDWSGVGQASSGAWLTMISPSYFVSATHMHPLPGESVSFYAGNSTASPCYTYTVDHWGYQTTNGDQGSDLWLGRLTQPVASAVTTYPVLELGSDAAYYGRAIYAYGRPNRVGMNLINRDFNGAVPPIGDYTDEGGKTRLVVFDYDLGEAASLGDDECHLIGGDSGGPTFSVVNGILALLGIHFTTSDTSNSFRDASPMWSGDSFVPFYVNQLNAHMGSESVRVVVPSPSTLVWSGAVNGNWDVDTTANFSGSPSGEFSRGDEVVFSDTGRNTAILLAAGGVEPGGVIFSNTVTKDYALRGGPLQGPTSLTVSGGGRVVLNQANTYTGGTIVSQGTLEIASGDALPAGGSLCIGSAGEVLLRGEGRASPPRATLAPEPPSLALLAMAALGLLAYARPRMRRR